MELAELEKKLHSYRETRVLLTGIELNVFTAVGDGATAAEVSGKLETDPRGTEMLLNALVALGMLTKQDGVFHNEPLARRYLTEGSEENIRHTLLHTVHRWNTWSTLTARIRGEVIPERFVDRGVVRHEQLLAQSNRKFSDGMARWLSAIGVDEVRRSLDIGGGSGKYSIALALANPTARVEIFDLPDVAPITRRYVDQAGLSDRIQVHAGDLQTDDFGSGYDLLLVCAVCHLQGEAENRDLFIRCRKALIEGGRLVIRDNFLTSDKTAPLEGVIGALHHLVSNPNGGNYSLDEYMSWLHDAGFSRAERRDTGTGRDALIATA